MNQQKGNHTHSIMPKKLAEALMEAGVQHFDAGGQVSSSPAATQTTHNIGEDPANTYLTMGGILGGKNSVANHVLNPVGTLLGGSMQNQFQAKTPDVTSQNFGPQIQAMQQRQNDVYAQQQNLAQALLAQSQGQGPNPALNMLNQQTGQNVQQQGALMASQRGASANPAIMARQIAMQGANIQQQGVSQAATLQAQQQLAAQQALAQQQQAMAGNALQGESIQQGGVASQNSAAMAGQNINAQIAAQNVANDKGILGGAISGFSGILGSLGGGGGSKKVGGSSGGGSSVSSNGFAGGFTGAAGLADGGVVPDYGQTPIQTMDSAEDDSGGGGGGGGGLGSILGLVAMLNQGGMTGVVPGKAEVKGDSKKNDKVPVMVSPGEIVIPRSIAQGKDAPEKAAEFIRHLKIKEKGYGPVAKAKKMAKGGRC